MMAVSPMTTPVPWSMKKLLPICRAGMDVDAGLRMRALGDDARDDRYVELVERMREPVMDDGLDAGIAEQHLVEALGRRIAVVGRAHVAIEHFENSRQLIGKFLHDGARCLVGIHEAFRGKRRRERQLANDLRMQRIQRLAKRMADEIVEGVVGAGSGPSVTPREQGRGDAVDGIGNLARRRERKHAPVGTDDTVQPAARPAERTYDSIDLECHS